MATKRSLPQHKGTKVELRPPELRKNMLALLEDIRRNEKVRNDFVTNPAGVIASQVTHRAPARSQISEVNRLLFALLANDQMRNFLSTFQPRSAKSKVAKEEFATAFAREIASIQDSGIVAALVGNALVGNGIPGLSNLMYQCVTNETTGKSANVCTPVAKAQAAFGGDAIDPETIRALSEALVARAKALANQGAIGNLAERIL